MFGIEFRISEQTSFLIESVTQTSLFIKGNVLTNSQDFLISRNTDVGVLGIKHRAGGFQWEVGANEDYNQERNEADITLFFELGWTW